jgi:2'-5' RNA ligase
MGRPHSRSNGRFFNGMVGLNNLAHADKSMIIAALPSPDDPVQKISSEPAAHLTILYLGDPGWDQTQLDMVTQFVEHAASLIPQFHLDVESRGVLGDKNADVLFFDKNWTKKIEAFRSQLLKNDLIARAYLSTDQFPEWTPHLTLGYPTSPAKKLDGYDRIYGVNFDRIALYTGNYTGPTFQLKRQSYDLEVAMSQTQRGRAFIMGDGISHYGVKGMHWGVRKGDSSGGGSGTDSKPAPKPRMSEDAKAVEKAFGKINRGGTDALSNHELQGLVTRLNLEQQYERLTSSPSQQQKNALDSGHTAVKQMLSIGKTVNDVHKFMKSPAGKALKGAFTAVKVGAAAYTGGASGAAAAGAHLVVKRAANHYTNVGR